MSNDSNHLLGSKCGLPVATLCPSSLEASKCGHGSLSPCAVDCGNRVVLVDGKSPSCACCHLEKAECSNASYITNVFHDIGWSEVVWEGHIDIQLSPSWP